MNLNFTCDEVISYIAISIIVVPIGVFICAYIPLLAPPVLFAALVRSALEYFGPENTFRTLQTALQDPFQQRHFLLPILLVLLGAIYKAYSRKPRHAATVGLWLSFTIATALRMLAVMTLDLSEPLPKDQNGNTIPPWQAVELIFLFLFCAIIREDRQNSRSTYSFVKKSGFPGRRYKYNVAVHREILEDTTSPPKPFIRRDWEDQACIVVWFEFAASIVRCIGIRWVMKCQPNGLDASTTEEVLTFLLVAAVVVRQLSQFTYVYNRRPSDVEEGHEKNMGAYYDYGRVQEEERVQLEFWSDSLQRLQQSKSGPPQ